MERWELVSEGSMEAGTPPVLLAAPYSSSNSPSGLLLSQLHIFKGEHLIVKTNDCLGVLWISSSKSQR